METRFHRRIKRICYVLDPRSPRYKLQPLSIMSLRNTSQIFRWRCALADWIFELTIDQRTSTAHKIMTILMLAFYYIGIPVMCLLTLAFWIRSLL
jgi:hypothetical protein